MDFAPDAGIAKRCIDKAECFSVYSRAYINTNEDLHLSMKYIPRNCNMALTVAGSGDHPLFCSLYGAKHVDTFDISYNAKCLMDIKTAALTQLNRTEYSQLLTDLYTCSDIKNVAFMKKISQQLPQMEYKYLCDMKGYFVFRRGELADLDNAETAGFALTKPEYNKLRKIVKQSYSCKIIDIVDLGHSLTESYDFIHFSNVLDHVSKQYKFKVLRPYLDHVNVGGRIVIQHIEGSARNSSWIPVRDILSSVFWNWKCTRVDNNKISILERVR